MLKYIQLQNGDKLEGFDDFGPFRCVVLISEDVSQDWQKTVSAWLVNSGCLYMMAWGRDCSSWDDSVDAANCEQFDHGEIPSDRFVMTTWHSDETLDEVLFFAKSTALHPEVRLENLLILDVCNSNREQQLKSKLEQL